MQAISPRIFSVILLVVAVLALSGIASTAGALVHADEAVACCNDDHDAGDSGSAPCSAPDCNCALCMAIDFVQLLSVSGATPALLAFTTLKLPFPPLEFVSPIDYPPESV